MSLDLQVGLRAYPDGVTTTYRIAEVAQRTGYSPPTLRYYEEIGLLPAPERAGNGYRVYDETTLERLGFITRAKQLGCSLEEITDLTQAWESGHCANVQGRLREVVDAKIADAQSRLASLAALVADLQRAAAVLQSHTPEGSCDDRCGCVSEGVVAPAPAPIVCTLDSEQMPGRLDDWKAALQDVAARRPVDGGIRLELGPEADIAELARLAAAEQGCCAFFRFDLVIDGRGPALEVRAPADGQTVLSAVFGA